MKNDNGIVTLSFDCEGRWGMADRNHAWLSELTTENLTEAYEYILETLSKYNIGATFAFVGASRAFGGTVTSDSGESVQNAASGSPIDSTNSIGSSGPTTKWGYKNYIKLIEKLN